jgi:flavodoxin I
MKSVVVYDSVYGNTEMVARRIAEALPGTVKVMTASGASPKELSGADLLVVGSPTVGGRATKPMQEFLDKIPRNIAERANIAAFDTRISMKFARAFGYAATRMAEYLSQKGCSLKVPPEGFIVKGRAGPLADGELDRAADWAKKLTRE